MFQCCGATGFKNFKLREYVASVHERCPEKCWPFASVSEREILKGKSAASDAPKDISKGKEVETAFPSAVELEIYQENRTISDAKGNADNVNCKFVIDTDDDSDMETLAAFLRKREGIKLTSPGSSRARKKKQKANKIDKTSKNVGPQHKKLLLLENVIYAVGGEMTLVKHKRSGSLGVGVASCSRSTVHRAVEQTGPKDLGPETGPAMLGDHESLVCSLNRNPADFSTARAESRFMRVEVE